MTWFNRLSIVPWYFVDIETWDMQEINVSNTVSDVKTKVSRYVEPSFNQNHIDQAREVTSILWETVLCSLLWGKKMKKKNNRWYDLLLPWWEVMESKTIRMWKWAVIKKNQLDIMDKSWFYGEYAKNCVNRNFE